MRATCWSPFGTARPRERARPSTARSAPARKSTSSWLINMFCWLSPWPCGGGGPIRTGSGIGRDNSRGRSVMPREYEAYAEMAKAEMRKIAGEIAARWPEARVAMAHRTGTLEIGEASVVVSVSSPHRAEAIDACRWGIDRLKESVPVWKKEHATDGTYWIEGDDSVSPSPERPTPRP